MTDHPAFLAAVLASPDEDWPRLVYADWLEENGRPERAEFIRVQVELAGPGIVDRVTGHWSGAGHEYSPFCQCRPCTLRRRARGLPGEFYGPHWRDWAGPAVALVPAGARFQKHLTFRRGFVESITCDTQTFLRHAAALFAAAPIREVRLSDKQPWRYAEGEVCWQFAGYDSLWAIPVLLKPPEVRLERHCGDDEEMCAVFRFDGIDEDDQAYDALSRWCVAYGRSVKR